MKTKGVVFGVSLVLLLAFTTVSAQAQVFDPLALGALGTAMGFAIGGSAKDAAIGGAAGLGAGLLLNAPQYASAGYYGYDRPYYGSAYNYGPRYNHHRVIVAPQRHYRYWVPGHYNYYGYWVRGHWRYY